MSLAEAIVAGAGLYAGLGMLFASWFTAFAVQRLDEAARGSGLMFRLVILPGAAALWPVLLWRWWRHD